MTHGIVCAAQPEAAEAGVLVLKVGGNAIDAAIACAITQGVVDPLMTGIGGVGSALVHDAKTGRTENINFLGVAPAAAREDMWEDAIEGETADAFGFILRERVNALGHQAPMVPGNLKGYDTLLRDYGTMSWSEVTPSAIAYADGGWVVRPHVYSYAMQDEEAQGRVHNAEIVGYTSEGRTLYLGSDGQFRKPGNLIRNPQLGYVLKTIASEGVDVFYKGDIGKRVAADMQANGGLITGEDLANYDVVRASALEGSYRGLRLATNRPGGSGIQVLETLNILENFDLSDIEHNSAAYIRILAEAISYAFNDKRNKVGDPAFVDVPLDALANKAYAETFAEKIRAGEKATLNRMNVDESQDTSHVSTLDEHGNAVTMTHTLGAPSGVITPGTGFILNGCMSIFDPRAGKAMSIAPGKSYTSSMSPTILFDDAGPHIVIGAPGAAYIPQAIAQSIVNTVDFGMSMSEAVSAPRIAITKNQIIEVSNRIPQFVTDEIEGMGYGLIRNYLSYAFAGVHGVKTANGGWQGGADPGRDGVALIV
ncbi:MAG: gamma-glutamyltransferase [Pseudomonadota bacterium]|nr:gamma-glutamyltransferase [Pseudomonadota bacterium]